jgi:hypothetical protein
MYLQYFIEIDTNNNNNNNNNNNEKTNIIDLKLEHG